MRIDEIIEKLMVLFACLPIYWFLKLGYWAWFDPDMLEKNLKYFRQYPSSASNIYFDKKSPASRRTFSFKGYPGLQK